MTAVAIDRSFSTRFEVTPGIINVGAANDNFGDDIDIFFTRLRHGIARWGYANKKGSEHYARWLLNNHQYRSQVTLAEIELTLAKAGALAEICGNVKTVVQAGASGSFPVFVNKPYHLLLELIARQKPDDERITYGIADVSEASVEKTRGYVKQLNLPLNLAHIPGDFFRTLRRLAEVDVIYIPGITIANDPDDAIGCEPEDHLTTTLSKFRPALKKGGVLIASCVNDNHIDPKGQAIKALYDDKDIHDYQLSIFEEVPKRLPVTGNYDPHGFGIRHEWRRHKHVLTRHATLLKPMQFKIGERPFDLRPSSFEGDNGYMANNSRHPDDMHKVAGKRAGFSHVEIFKHPSLDTRLIAYING